MWLIRPIFIDFCNCRWLFRAMSTVCDMSGLITIFFFFSNKLCWCSKNKWKVKWLPPIQNDTTIYSKSICQKSHCCLPSLASGIILYFDSVDTITRAKSNILKKKFHVLVIPIFLILFLVPCSGKNTCLKREASNLEFEIEYQVWKTDTRTSSLGQGGWKYLKRER